MTSEFDKALDSFDYAYPPELIAQQPASPRDAARLIVFDRATGRTEEAFFADLPDYLPDGAVLVFNDTRVLPARLELTKETGGRVVILYLGREGDSIRVMADRRLQVGTRLVAPGISLLVERHEGRFWRLRPSVTVQRFLELLERRGQAPLPPYIKETPLSAAETRRQYQSVFARHPGSVAAPTASLHFTKRLLERLRRKGFGTEYVTLHVNLGTFAPLTAEQLDAGRLHVEHYEIGRDVASRLNRTKKAGRPIIAVGTTSLRALESAAIGDGQLKKLRGDTDIFIREGDKFFFVDGLITNFHVPKSSLLMLVAALAGRTQVMRLYRLAISHRYRLFSFGDGMLIK